MQDIAAFIRSQPAKVFPKNSIITQQGEKPDAIYGIRSGIIKLTDISVDGYEQILWLAKKYDVVPLEWLFSTNEESPFFYSAHTDVEVFVVSKDDFLDHIKNDAHIQSEINKLISLKQRQLLEHIAATLKPKARDKIAHMLYHIGLRFCEDEKQTTVIQLTHQNIANLVGVSRETASIELAILKSEEFIDYSKQNVTIHTNKLIDIVDTI